MSNKLVDYRDPTINFNQDIIYGCSLAYSKAALDTLCGDSDAAAAKIKGLQIFANLEEIRKFGTFGNANIFFSQNDW